MKWFKLFFSVILVLLFSQSYVLSQLDNWKIYTNMNSDLPSNIVNYVEIDGAGTKWISSANKLVKMIGQNMTIYSPPTSFGIREFGEIAIDPNGNKWMRSYYHGLIKYEDNGTWTQYNRANGYPGSDTVTSVTIDSNYNIWVGSFQGLAKWNGTTWQHFNGPDYIPHRIINALEYDKDNNLWVGTAKGLVKFDGTNWIKIDSTVFNLKSNYIISIDVNTRNEIFIGTTAGMAKFNGVSWVVHNPTVDNDKLNNNIWTICSRSEIQGRDDEIWIGFMYDYDRVAAKYDSTEWFFFGPENSKLPPLDIKSIAVDSNNHVWFGTYLGGLVEFFDDRSYRDSSRILVVDFSATPRTGSAPLNVQFTDLSKGMPTGWLWDFGDGQTSTTQHPSHTYNNSGTYTVSLKIQNINGADSLIKTAYIIVSPETGGTANFICNPLKGCLPLSVSFTDRSTGSPQSWLWDFGDGSTSTQRNPVHTYSKTGVYSIYLDVQYNGYSSRHGRINYVEIVNCDSVDIELKTPESGARLLANTMYPITWEVTQNINYVCLWYSTNNGVSWNQINDRIPARPEKYNWRVPNLVAHNCLMRIEDCDSAEINDINPFSIISNITISGKDTLKVCADWDGREIKTNFITETKKRYRITLQGTYSLLDRLNACPNEGDLSCGFDAAYVYDVEDRAISAGNWPPLTTMSLPRALNDPTLYSFAGNKKINLFQHTGFRFNRSPIIVDEYKKNHEYILEKNGTGDYFTFSIIDSIIDGNRTIPQYEDNDDCISIIIEEIDSVDIGYCGFEFIRDPNDSTKIIGMQLEAGVFINDTNSITGKRNILGEIEVDELGVVINGKFICPIDSIVCDSKVTKSEKEVHFGLLVDMSSSMDWDISDTDNTVRMDALKTSLTGFVNNMRNEDSAFIISFNTYIFLEQDWTNNKNLLKNAINTLDASGWTQLWGGLDSARKKLLHAPAPRAMIVLSDGGNSIPPYINQLGLLNKIKGTNEMPIYVIALGLSNDPLDVSGRDTLRMIAEASGGKIFDVDNAAQLSQVYQDILEAETSNECCRIYFHGDIDSCGWVKLIYSPERDDLIARAYDYCGDTLSTPDGVMDEDENDVDFSIYPNPFSNSTKFDYSMTKRGEVKIILMDLIGNTIFEKHNGLMEAGSYFEILDGSKIPSGTYVAIVMLDGVAITRKVVVLR
jgi:PKD repeat protein